MNETLEPIVTCLIMITVINAMYKSIIDARTAQLNFNKEQIDQDKKNTSAATSKTSQIADKTKRPFPWVPTVVGLAVGAWLVVRYLLDSEPATRSDVFLISFTTASFALFLFMLMINLMFRKR